MSIPIIFFHYGNAKYLKYSLKQARHFNPHADIFLLGDDRNDKYPFLTHVRSSIYKDNAKAFAERYVHRSSNGEDYELFCFLRWFYIEAFCNENGVEEFIYLDSDVLLFQDVSKVKQDLQKFAIANTGETAGMPAFTYFRDYATLKSFCDYLLDSYSDPHQIERIERIYKPYAENPKLKGGISDMTLFQMYFEDHPHETGKIYMINENLAVDSNISLADGYETEAGIKKIYWNNKLPFGRELATGRLVRFASLHYQGDAKVLMARHFKAPGYTYQRVKERLGISSKIKAVRQAVKSLFKKKAP